MKKLLFVVAVLSLSLLLFGCKKEEVKNTNPTTNINTSVNAVTGEEEYQYGIVEYNDTDFTDRTDFKVNKSDEFASNISYDGIMLHDRDSAQLDLTFPNKKIGSLMVSKREKFVTNSSATTSSLVGVTLTSWTEEDGSSHYYWEKDNSFYEFVSFNDFTNEELSSLINGFSIEMDETK